MKKWAIGQIDQDGGIHWGVPVFETEEDAQADAQWMDCPTRVRQMEVSA